MQRLHGSSRNASHETSKFKNLFYWIHTQKLPYLACHGAGGGRGTAVEAQAWVWSTNSETFRGASSRGQVLLLDLQVGPAFHCWGAQQEFEGELSKSVA